MDRIIAFYREQMPDHAGRMISEIWAFSHEALEDEHDYIQWLFPLEVPSPVNPAAPVLSSGTMQTFQEDAGLRQRMKRSLDIMLDFYGLARAGPEIVRGKHFAERSRGWLRAGNHNHLRLTRMMHCLKLCGLGDEAQALLGCLLKIAEAFPRAVTPETVGFWQRAV